jgi:GT2 family glycosyltransferase
VRPELSVVIPSHNRPDLLAACLRSVRSHAPAGAEVLVVDDASPDGSISRVAAAFATAVLRLPRRRGFCTAANAGVNATRGQVVELLNDDTEVSAGWAAAALAGFRDPAVAAVAPLVLVQPADGSTPARVDSAGDRYYLGGVAAKRGHGQPPGPDWLERRRVFGASASSAFYRRDALLRVGGFPEAFGAYFEDVDVAFRLHRAGYSVLFEPEARVFHRVSASYGRPGRQLLERQSRNEEWVFWRNLPARVLCRALPLHLAVVAAKGWRRWQEGRLIPFICGRLRVLGEAPALVRHRRALQQCYPATGIEGWELEDAYWGAGPRLTSPLPAG